MSGPFGSSQWMYASGGFYDFPISNSLRFEDGDSAYLNRTPSASNRRTWTWSGWVKRSTIITSNQNCFFGAWADDNNRFKMNFYQDKIEVVHVSGGTSYNFKITQLFRDVSAWYHIVLAVDTTQGTDTNRYKIYINGEQVTAFDNVAYPAQNFDGAVNSAIEHTHGESDGSANYLDGYLAEVNFIDGTALTPASFGELKNDIWIPKNTSGLTFGSQGFRLQFKQSGTGTASSSTIGADTSGNTNHWTSNNLVASDVVLDSPTNNFATLNPLSTLGTVALSEGNLKVQIGGSNAVDQAFPTFALPTTGKWYCEVGVVTIASGYSAIGLSASSERGSTGQTPRHGYLQDGQKIAYSTKSSYGNSFANGDVLGIAVDRDNRKLYFAKNGTWQASGDPVAGNNAAFTSITQENNLKVILYNATTSGTAGATTFVFNAGQDSSFAGTETAQGNADGNGIGDFYYAPPTGFLALCTANLPDPVETIDPAQGGSPQDYFNTVLYSGNSSTQAITGVGFQPDFTWSKTRNVADHHILVDSVRGDKALRANGTNTEYDTGVSWQFNSDGFTMTGTSGELNHSGRTFVTWNWKAGTAFSNDASATGVGSIDSSGSVNTDVGFSIISYTGTGSNATVAHGLSKAPELYIVKSRTSPGGDWKVYSENVGNTYQGFLNGNEAFENSGASIWQNTSPTSSVFSIGTNAGVNNSGTNFITYCFHSVESYSRIGKYTGNGSTDGPFIYTGFRPAFIMFKDIGYASDWCMFDNKRAGYNSQTDILYPNLTNAEDTSNSVFADILSNGFKWRFTNADFNASGNNYIYMAFAEQSQKFANAR